RHLDRVGQVLGNAVGIAGVRVHRSQVADRTVKGAGNGGIPGRVAVDVDNRRRVGMHRERGGDVLLGSQQAGQVSVDLAYLAVGAWHSHAIAVWRGGRAAHEVVVFVCGYYKERVALVDAICRQPVEERREALVVSVQGGHVARLA